MHWFGNNAAGVAVWLVGGLWGLCVPLAGTRAAGDPSSPQTGKAGPLRKEQSPDWGERLSVSPKSTPAEKKEAASGGVSGSQPSGAGPLAIPLVPGYDSFGLSLPDHDLEGRLRSLFVIGAVSRLDDAHVEIRESFLETYAEDGSPEFSIELPKATLDRFTRVLVAKTPVTLRKAEFELKGASLEFNTVTKEGGLGGPVQMTIYNGAATAAQQPTSPPTPPVNAAPPAPR